MEVIGIGYLAIICQNLQESINFYCKGLGFEEIYQETNRDDKESTQVLLMTKSGNGIIFSSIINIIWNASVNWPKRSKNETCRKKYRRWINAIPYTLCHKYRIR